MEVVHRTKFQIRSAKREDASRIAILSTQLGYPATPEEIRERFVHVARESTSSIFVAVSESGEVLGWLHVMRQVSLESGPRAEIMGLIVDEQARGSGIGRALMAQAERWARKHACAVVNLRSNVIRDAAHTFYERLGYKLIKTQKCLRKLLNE